MILPCNDIQRYLMKKEGDAEDRKEQKERKW